MAAVVLDSVFARHLDVHEDDVGAVVLLLELVVAFDGFFSVGGFADDLEAWFEFEDGVEALAHEGLVFAE